MLLLSAAAAFVLAVALTLLGPSPWAAAPFAVAAGSLLPAAGPRMRLTHAAVALAVVTLASGTCPPGWSARTAAA